MSGIMKCPKCGAEYPKVYRLCADCRVELEEPGSPKIKKRKHEKKRPKQPHDWREMCISLLVFLIVGGAVLILGKRIYYGMQRTVNPGMVVEIVVLLGLIAVLILNLISEKRCPKCGRRSAMRQTEITDYDPEGSGLVCRKWACRHCGYVVWRPLPDHQP